MFWQGKTQRCHAPTTQPIEATTQEERRAAKKEMEGGLDLSDTHVLDFNKPRDPP